MLKPPISSPQMMRMLGFLPAVCASAGPATSTSTASSNNRINGILFFGRIVAVSFFVVQTSCKKSSLRVQGSNLRHRIKAEIAIVDRHASRGSARDDPLFNTFHPSFCSTLTGMKADCHGTRHIRRLSITPLGIHLSFGTSLFRPDKHDIETLADGRLVVHTAESIGLRVMDQRVGRSGIAGIAQLDKDFHGCPFPRGLRL